MFRSWRRTRSGDAAFTADATSAVASAGTPATPSAGRVAAAPNPPQGAAADPFPVWTVELMVGGIIWVITPQCVFERRTVNTWLAYWMIWPPPPEIDDDEVAQWLERQARDFITATYSRKTRNR
jgi:hypothetical protein